MLLLYRCLLHHVARAKQSPQTQWQKTKKQSREERQAAKRAKLDPASHKTAQDVLDENARKRKRELEAEAEDSSSVDLDMDVEKEKPMEGLRAPAGKAKKLKTANDEDDNADVDANADASEAIQSKRAKARADKRRQKLEKKKEKQALKQQKQEAKKAQQEEFSKGLSNAEEKKDEDDDGDANESDVEPDHDDDDERIEALDVSGLVDESHSATQSSANSNASSASIASTASSSTSIVPPGEESSDKKEKKSLMLDEKNHDAFRARLAMKLDAMRAARKADGPDGRPARNRAELIEARRKKEAERKAAKKASRQLAKEDEERLKAEEQLARIRGGSGSPSLFSLRSSPENERNLSFGRVAWADGQQLESSLSGFLETKKKKGRSDPKTALEAAKKKQARVNGYDEQKRKEIEEKDAWLAAKKRAQGEKVFDDPNLLKKTLKRQEKVKAKSKQEWVDRLTNVQKGKEARQKKREENLRKRREDKGSKGKKKAVKKPGKKVKRPGFEGTFKAR